MGRLPNKPDINVLFLKTHFGTLRRTKCARDESIKGWANCRFGAIRASTVQYRYRAKDGVSAFIARNRAGNGQHLLAIQREACNWCKAGIVGSCKNP